MEITRNIIVYRDHLLYPSETFIRAQGEGLKSFKAYYTGVRRVNGLEMPEERIVILNNGTTAGKVKEALFKLFGIDYCLVKRLKNLNADLIHAHFGSDGVLALPLADKLKLPLIVTFHGFDAAVKDEYARKSFYSHRLYLRKRSVLQNKADLFIAVSDFIKSKMVQQGYDPGKIVKHYIGIDLEVFKPDLSIPREPVVLFVGRLVENKGCKYLIHAMHYVQQDLPGVKLVVIGDGPLRASLEKNAAKVLKNYSFLGVRPQEEVRWWMNRASVFCVPSVEIDSGESEAFGIVFAEASAMGCPVVSFSTGGIPEAVKHGETGFLAPPGDYRTLAYHIDKLLVDNSLWTYCSEKGRERVRCLFNLEKQTELLEQIYMEWRVFS